ncbi:unnamed protein product [Pleuronectes platessa]|uniref:Secreted protein n=1 Tax=Pleuronectes platessa TaxID=8262 RepID=A0A9N7VD57_PLEPL|nr:unnamed protein product [Pleuronectes platessa]
MNPATSLIHVLCYLRMLQRFTAAVTCRWIRRHDLQTVVVRFPNNNTRPGPGQRLVNTAGANFTEWAVDVMLENQAVVH